MPTKRARTFKPGDKTDRVWSGDIVTKCTFLGDLGQGRLHFYDETFKCFRSAYWQPLQGEFVLNGWNCSATPFGGDDE